MNPTYKIFSSLYLWSVGHLKSDHDQNWISSSPYIRDFSCQRNLKYVHPFSRYFGNRWTDKQTDRQTNRRSGKQYLPPEGRRAIIKMLPGCRYSFHSFSMFQQVECMLIVLMIIVMVREEEYDISSNCCRKAAERPFFMKRDNVLNPCIFYRLSWIKCHIIVLLW